MLLAMKKCYSATNILQFYHSKHVIVSNSNKIGGSQQTIIWASLSIPPS